jgi:hypothetical protein
MASGNGRTGYGSWISPISSSLIAEKNNRITEIGVGGEDGEMVYWIERRPAENGRNAICGYNLKTKELRWTLPAV